jgi:hypothetical protein
VGVVRRLSELVVGHRGDRQLQREHLPVCKCVERARGVAARKLLRHPPVPERAQAHAALLDPRTPALERERLAAVEAPLDQAVQRQAQRRVPRREELPRRAPR